MKISQFILFACRLTIVILLLHSCAAAYVPNKVNTPMLTNKGELQVSVNAGISGFDPQAAWAITDHLGIMANGSFENRTSDSTDNFHTHRFVELAPGYYTRFGRVFRFETFGGIGLGNTLGLYGNNLWVTHADASFMRFFLQPGVGLSTHVVDLSLASRFCLVTLSQNDNFSAGLFMEPVLSLKLGYKYVKLISQIGFSLPLGEQTISFNYQPFLFSMGLQVTLFRD